MSEKTEMEIVAAIKEMTAAINAQTVEMRKQNGIMTQILGALKTR